MMARCIELDRACATICFAAIKTSHECNVTQTTGHRTKSDTIATFNTIKNPGGIKYDRRGFWALRP
jgi:hypothetical protein